MLSVVSPVALVIIAMVKAACVILKVIVVCDSELWIAWLFCKNRMANKRKPGSVDMKFQALVKVEKAVKSKTQC